MRDLEAIQKHTQSCIIRFKQYMSHAICCLFNKLKRTFASIEFKTNGPALLFKIQASCHLLLWIVQRAKKVVSDSPGLVDFAIGLVNSVFNLPKGQVMFFEEFE